MQKGNWRCFWKIQKNEGKKGLNNREAEKKVTFFFLGCEGKKQDKRRGEGQNAARATEFIW